jgi:hypothetical protein
MVRTGDSAPKAGIHLAWKDQILKGGAMVARSSVLALALLVGGAPHLVMSQATSVAKPLAIGAVFPFSKTTNVRVLTIGEKNATALRGRERKSPFLLDLEFDAGSESEVLTLLPRMAFVLRVGDQRFPVDYIACHRLDQPTAPPQVFPVTDGFHMAWIFNGKAMVGLLFDLPPESAESTKKLLEIAFSEEGQPILVSVDK